jgi:exosome complex RNA-binding protein Csl4
MSEDEKGIEGKMVMPGDELACSEEFEAGDYAYEEGGKVKASAVGWAHLDLNNRVARVEPVNPLVKVSVGDLVIARITDIKKALALTDVLKVVGKERGVSGAPDGVIHVSKVANRFVDNLDNELRVRDIVRAKVTQVEPNIQLSTQDDNLGVIYAICDGCAKRLENKGGGKLFCKDCERTFVRKMASDYGTWSEAPGA